MNHLAVPLTGGDFSPLLSGLQTVVDAAVLSSGGDSVFRFSLLVGADGQEPPAAMLAASGKIARRHALVEVQVQKAEQALEDDLFGKHQFPRFRGRVWNERQVHWIVKAHGIQIHGKIFFSALFLKRNCPADIPPIGRKRICVCLTPAGGEALKVRFQHPRRVADERLKLVGQRRELIDPLDLGRVPLRPRREHVVHLAWLLPQIGKQGLGSAVVRQQPEKYRQLPKRPPERLEGLVGHHRAGRAFGGEKHLKFRLEPLCLPADVPYLGADRFQRLRRVKTEGAVRLADDAVLRREGGGEVVHRVVIHVVLGCPAAPDGVFEIYLTCPGAIVNGSGACYIFPVPNMISNLNWVYNGVRALTRKTKTLWKENAI